MKKEKQTRPTRGQPPKSDKLESVYISIRQSKIATMGGKKKAQEFINSAIELFVKTNQQKL